MVPTDLTDDPVAFAVLTRLEQGPIYHAGMPRALGRRLLAAGWARKTTRDIAGIAWGLGDHTRGPGHV